MKQVFVDTSAWLAVADHTDQHHHQAREYYLGLIRRKEVLVTSSDVLSETYSRFQRTTGHRGAARFHSIVEIAQRQGLLRVIAVNAEIARKAWDIFERYHDRLSSFRHCTSFVVAGRLGIQDVFSFDEDFSAIGFRVWPPRGANGSADLTE